MKKVSFGLGGTLGVSLGAIGLAASGLQAGTCSSQPSNLAVSGTIIQSDGVNERAADNLTLTASDVLAGFCWRGVYVVDPTLADCSSGAVDNFTIKVYSSVDGGGGQCLPDQLLATYVQGAGPTNVAVTRTQVGTPFGIPEFEWEATLNDPNQGLLVQFGSCIWVEITAPDQGAACTFFLSLSDNTKSSGDGNSLVDVTTGTPYGQEDLQATDLAIGVKTVLGEGLLDNSDSCNLITCIDPLNDDCADFIAISGNVVDLPFFNFNATNDGPLVPDDCPGQQSETGDPGAIGADIWYRWTATASGSTQISTCGSGYDGVLVVYTNDNCPVSTIAACDDDGCGGGSPSFVILPNVVNGEIFMIRIGGWQSETTLTGVLNITTGGPGACCFISTNDCSQATEADGSDCTAAGGLYQGIGTTCGDECPGSVCTADSNDPAQLPIPTQGGASSSHVFTVADDFVLNANDTITGVCLWGGHRIGTSATDCGADPGGGSPNTWRIRIYGTTIVDGTPIPNQGAILSETTVTDPPRVATGNQLADQPLDEYSYHITLDAPFAATANTCYWLEVRAPEDLTVPLGTGCRFRWELSPTGDSVAFQPPNPDVNGYSPADGVAFDTSWVLETTGSAGIGNLVICTPNPVPLECAGGLDTLTESTAGNITAGGVACAAGGITDSNTYARSTNVGAAPFEVCSVDMGVSNSGSPLETTVNLYSDNDGGAPNVGGLTLLASESFTLPNTGNTLANVVFDPPVCVAANTQLVVEWVIPASTDGFATFAGNSLGESSATYILSAACAINDYTPMADIGFPDSHWVLGVCGDAGACDGQCAGGDTCPADIAPAAGGDCNADGNGDVGPGDLGELLANWGANPANDCADIAPVGNPDGNVGPGDLGELLANWGQC